MSTSGSTGSRPVRSTGLSTRPSINFSRLLLPRPRRPSSSLGKGMSRRSSLVFIPLSLSVLFLAQACSRTSAAPAPPPPPSVSVVTVQPERVALTDEWVATLDGNVNAQIRPQVSGYLIRRAYTEGGVVRKGQVLFEIDPRPFAAALAAARARMAEAQAQLGKAQRDVARDKPLADQRAIPQSQLDNDQQAALAAEAAVQSASAAVQTAELNLEFTKVTSLVDGV